MNAFRICGRDLKNLVPARCLFEINPLVVTIFLISAPAAANSLAEFVLFEMQDYLTDVWGLDIVKAALILNIWGGICRILPVFLLFFADACMGNYRILVISGIASSMGMGFISLSSTGFFAKCKNIHKSNCFSTTQKVLFCTGMALFAVGRSGNLASTKGFILEQMDEKPAGTDEKDEKPAGTVEKDEKPAGTDVQKKKWGKRILRIIFAGFGSLIGALALPYIGPWSLRLGIPAICTVVALLLFMIGCGKYNKPGPQGSQLKDVCKVLVASFKKRSLTLPPRESNSYYRENDENTIIEFTETRFLSCLEKAAILSPRSSKDPTKAKDEWRLCTVSEVENTKIVVRMIPMWLTFIIIGFISSHANTYFVQQAIRMNPHIGQWEVPLPMFLFFHRQVKQLYACIHTSFETRLKENKLPELIIDLNKLDNVPAIVIGLAMIQSVLCCVTAAIVESTRLKVVKKYDLFDLPDEKVPMSTHWLLFQFFLLAGLDSLFESGVNSFYRDQAPEQMREYLKYMTEGVSGLGFMFSVILVNTIIQNSWFQPTLNKSRLDKYYWLLAIISSVNLVVYIFVASFYRYKQAQERKEEEMDDDAEIPSVTSETFDDKYDIACM